MGRNYVHTSVGLREALRGLRHTMGSRQALGGLEQALGGHRQALGGLTQAMGSLRQVLGGPRQALEVFKQALGMGYVHKFMISVTCYTEVQREFLPILQDSVPYRGRCPKNNKIRKQ